MKSPDVRPVDRFRPFFLFNLSLEYSRWISIFVRAAYRPILEVTSGHVTLRTGGQRNVNISKREA